LSEEESISGSSAVPCLKENVHFLKSLGVQFEYVTKHMSQDFGSFLPVYWCHVIVVNVFKMVDRKSERES
jgi:hypothetical protein